MQMDHIPADADWRLRFGRYARARKWHAITDGIGLSQFKRAYRGIAFANCLGLALNTKVDISWSTVNVVGDDVLPSLHQWLARIDRWFERQGVPAVYFWVQEHGWRFGLHTHLFFHVPTHLFRIFGDGVGFNEHVRLSLEKVVRRPLVQERSVRTVRIHHAEGRPVGWQWDRFRYMMKGFRLPWWEGAPANPTWEFADRAQLILRDKGCIAGRRVGFARLLQDRSFNDWAQVNVLPDMTIARTSPIPYDDRYFRWFDTHGAAIQVPLIERCEALPSQSKTLDQ
ncbi:hypothetical protein [Sphingomonas crocodyli]|uniref:Uncharacterized protein n=1 Tax=Sphingomonas crocodyli TaxID=1979270 RepID=A0A437M731_9SPHN|nr:hypothetical protein [Sphingomonas crocodyli]RVT93437.1 hypothetical protein EOD43_06050 [Sphingomonas crocodyli]